MYRHLQQIVKSMQEEWLTIVSKSVLLYERIVELQGKDLPEQAQTRTDWGVLMFNLGNLESALEQLSKTLQLCQEAYGETHPAHPHIAACTLIWEPFTSRQGIWNKH